MKIAVKNMLKFLTVSTTAIILNSGASFAESPSTVITKFRAFGVFPEQKQKFNTAPTNNVTTSTNKIFKNGFGGEISGSYFYSPNFASEIGVGFYGQKFKDFNGVSAMYGNASAPSAKAKRTFFIPVTGTLQFHVDPAKEFSPYIGGGYSYTFSTHSSKMAKVSNLHGPVIQAGFDINTKDNYGFNFDVKKYFTKGHIKYNTPITSMPVKSKLKDNPVFVGFGFTFKDII